MDTQMEVVLVKEDLGKNLYRKKTLVTPITILRKQRQL